jgi:hypothetical protein
MKNVITTIAIVLSVGMTTFAQEAFTGVDGVAECGLFNLGTSFFTNSEELFLFSEYYDYDEEYVAYGNQPQNYVDNGFFGMGGGTLFGNTRNGGLVLPTEHGATDDANAPLGSGIAVLMGLGAAYLINRKRKEE